MYSQPQNDKTILRNTIPNPFHLYTEVQIRQFYILGFVLSWKYSSVLTWLFPEFQERGVEKERKLFSELLQKQIEEERSRNPKATPYPYTTDYPVVWIVWYQFSWYYPFHKKQHKFVYFIMLSCQIPPKPEPKPCTKTEPFELESLIRHEEEMRREMEERKRLEEEEAKMRLFKAQPILIE